MMALSQDMNGDNYVVFRGEDCIEKKCNGSHEQLKFVESLGVLDPDDPLMRRFQSAFNIHLNRINAMLSEEFHKLTVANKRAEEKRLQDGNIMYGMQHEIVNELTSIEKWRTSLEMIGCWRDEEEKNSIGLTESRDIFQLESSKQRRMAELMSHDIESMSSLLKRLAEYKTEVYNHLVIARNMSEKDTIAQREFMRKKQQTDYFLWRVSENIWKLQQKLYVLQKQIQYKTDERLTINQTAADINFNFGMLEREQKKLIDSWHSVIFSIQHRDKAYEKSSIQLMNLQQLLRNIQERTENIKKNMSTMMKYNGQLAKVASKINDELFSNEEEIDVHASRYQVLQHRIDTLMKLVESANTQFSAFSFKHERLIAEENTEKRELKKLIIQKNVLEDEVMEKLEDKMTQNATMKNMNESLRNTKEAIKRFELAMLQIENHYAKCLLQITNLNHGLSTDNIELVEFDNTNNCNSNCLSRLHNDIKKFDMMIEKKQKISAELIEKNNRINFYITDKMMTMITPHSMKIAFLEKNIALIEGNNKEGQRHWLRQEALIVHLTDVKNNVIQKTNHLSKQIIIIQQKESKLENFLGEEHKNERDIERRMDEMYQRLLRATTLLSEHRDTRNELQTKNTDVKNDYMNTLHHNEQEFLDQQNKIGNLIKERSTLTEKLQNEKHNYFVWNNELKIAVETTKIIKLEQDPGGNVAMMRSEIRRMEMRLLYLRKVQNKMIQDMEHCVTRREIIVDNASMQQMKNPKLMHNKQIMIQKRIDGRKLEIKQTRKATATIEIEISNVGKKYGTVRYKDGESVQSLESYREDIKELDKQMTECEIMKHHDLERLVRKQRKIKLFQNVSDSRYRMRCKSITVLNGELNNQKTLNNDLIEIMEQTYQDFPLFSNYAKQILLTLHLID